MSSLPVRPGTPYTSTLDIADQLRRVADQRGPHLTPLPFNRFEKIDQTTWWLAPTNENPAFKYGKIACTRENFEPSMFIGLYVEKGFTAPGNYPGKKIRWQMDSTWLWSSFIQAMKSGDVDRLADEVELRTGAPICIALDGGVEGTPSEDWDFIEFARQGGMLSQTSDPHGCLAGLANVRTLPELVATIGKIPSLDWTWLDFHLGVLFSFSEDGGWTPSEIWDRVCQPMRPWLR